MTRAPEPWQPGSGPAIANKRFAPATERNRDAIVAVLRGVLPLSGLVLEVASGSGEHAVHFAEAFPDLDWQPTDPDPAALASIAAWAGEAPLPNLRPPIRLDASAPWPIDRADAILCINMVHISSWNATVGLFTQGARHLQKGAPLILYGPYFRKDHPTVPSNLAFDESLRARNAEWGIRWLEDVNELAERQGFAVEAVYAMPANNLTVAYRRV
jgi:hypothetical protein